VLLLLLVGVALVLGSILWTERSFAVENLPVWERLRGEQAITFAYHYYFLHRPMLP
jgi:hypothetical protein